MGSNSDEDVWGMQCFCSVVSKMASEHAQQFRKQHCNYTASPKHLNYRGLVETDGWSIPSRPWLNLHSKDGSEIPFCIHGVISGIMINQKLRKKLRS